MRFSRENRLLKREQFDHVFNRPIKVFGKCLDFYIRTNDLTLGRLGFVFSKKAFKRAVDRNHIKRLTREFFRNNAQVFSGHDIVAIAKKKTVFKRARESACLEAVSMDFKKLAERIG